MKELNKWIDVRKRQVREVTKMDLTIKKLEDINAYLTLKEVKELEQPYFVYINGEKIKKLDKGFTVMEYTPLDKNYNLRVHINHKLEILEYYFDITLKNEIRNEVPYYNDLYLDVVYYQPAATKDSTYIYLSDEREIKDALNKDIIDKEEFDLAYKATDELLLELKNKTNKFVNRGLDDYFKYRKN